MAMNPLVVSTWLKNHQGVRNNPNFEPNPAEKCVFSPIITVIQKYSLTIPLLKLHVKLQVTAMTTGLIERCDHVIIALWEIIYI